MSSWFEKIVTTTLKKLINNGVKKINESNEKKAIEDMKNNKETIEKNHPWRLCPTGKHWVKPHFKRLATGTMTNHDGHCRNNLRLKSEFYTGEELLEIAKKYFDELIDNQDLMPISDDLGFPNGNQYDKEIAGWTKFWNDILRPETPLDPDIVKVLIATESSFIIPKDQKSKDGAARGLIQITENTRRILQDTKGELRNHHIRLSVEETRVSTTNIAAGIRWLHHKKFLAENRLKRKISWKDSLLEYKGISNDIGKDEITDRIVTKIEKYYQKLKEQRMQLQMEKQ